jgi:hypothetical protein
MSLERRPVNQAMTAADMRYQLVVNTLARIAYRPGELPGLGIVTDGTVNLNDTVNIDVKTALDGLKGFTSEALTGGVTRSPQQQWTIDTAFIPEQILVARAACEWIMIGSPPQDKYIIKLLKQFQVYNDMVCLVSRYPGWLCGGCKKDCAKERCFVAECCGGYVWVVPNGLKGLSEFTLILADVATIAPPTLTGIATVTLTQKDPTPAPPPTSCSGSSSSPPKPIPLTTVNVPFLYDVDNPTKIKILAPVIVYGVAANAVTSNIIMPDKSQSFCTPTPELHEFAKTNGTEAELLLQENQMGIRRLPPSGSNPAFDFHMQQQQEQMQSQLFLNSR